MDVASAVTQDSSVVAGSGNRLTNTTVQTVYVVAQPGTTEVSGNDQFTHYAGFIGAAFIQPGVTNAQGVALEADPDNDNDGLTDADEVSGAAFEGYASTDPNNVDTDGDFMSDYDEAQGMYDPNDPNDLLVVKSLTYETGNFCLEWIGRGGGTTNIILCGDDLISGGITNQFHSAPYAGGNPPWYKVTNSYIWPTSGKMNTFYRIKTVR